MKLNRKTMSRTATTLVATAMIAVLATVPASAANAEVSFTKAIDMEHAVGASVPYITYSYSIAAGTPVAADPVTNTPEIKAGDADDFSIQFTGEENVNVVSFGPSDTVNSDTKKVSKEAKLAFDQNAYNAPRIYRYEISETPDVQISGLEYNDSMTPAYVLDVYVTYNESKALEVTHAIWMREAITPTFVNGTTDVQYGTEPQSVKIDGDEDAYTTYTLTIEKQIEGKMADAGRAYDFSVVLTGLPKGTTVSYGASNAENPTKYETAADTTGKIQLDGVVKLNPEEAMTIYGLPANTAYQVIENLEASEGYTVSAKLNSTDNVRMSPNQNKDAYESVTVDLKQNNEDATVSDSFVVTNKREEITPTGVIMNVAPYVLMVVIAAAGCFVFLRKRRDD